MSVDNWRIPWKLWNELLISTVASLNIIAIDLDNSEKITELPCIKEYIEYDK